MKFPIFHNSFRSLGSSFQPKIVGTAVLAIAVFFVLTGQAASPGALDLTFGVRGNAPFNLPSGSYDISRALAIQPDGKIVTAGYVNSCSTTCNANFTVIRLNADGTTDTGFGTNGIVTTDFFGQNEAINAVVVQADGKIVVAGGPPSNGTGDVTGFKLVRYMPDGSLDTTFGTAGRVYESNNDLGGNAQSIILQPDGKLVVAGTDFDPASNVLSTLYVVRFNPDGSLDTSFGTGGRIASAAYDIRSTLLVREPDEKIIVVGISRTSTNTLKLVRFNADGSPDNSFGTGGVAVSTFTNYFTPTIAIQTDGKILVSGGGDPSFTPPLRRFNTDGSVDSSFVPQSGGTISGICNCTANPVKILLAPDGRFYLVGYTGVPISNRSITVTRYLNNGSIDPSFGFRGTSFIRYSNNNSSINRVFDAALQSDGKIVISASAFIPTPIGGSTLQPAAIRINTTITLPSVRGDFDGDRKTDFAVFRPSNRFWYVLNSFDNSFLAQRYGEASDVLAPSDYNYDRKTDLAVFRPSVNTWYISPSQPGGGSFGDAFGQSSDITVPEDYDGDGYTDLAVFRPSDGTWRIRYSSLSLGIAVINTIPFGTAGDKPVAGDYDGDGRADLAVFRPSNGFWYILRTSDGGVTSIQFGISTDKTVQADYDGDGKTDLAVFRASNRTWYILQSTAGFIGFAFGLETDLPVPGDYDGDGKTDIGVFRASEGNWYVWKSSDSSLVGAQFGIAEDIPTPFTFVR